MRVFVTGATGFIGSAVVRELLDAGHQVLGLARSDAGAKSLAAAGAEVHRGSLEDLDSLRSGVVASDGVIHTAFIHDFNNYGPAAEADRRAIEALGTALAGSGRPLLITSGTLLAHRWPAVHRLDAAHLYRLVLEKGRAGANYHGVGDEGIPTRQIAEVIGRRLHVPVVAKSFKESSDHFGWIGHFFGIDAPASSALTRERLGWQPKQSGLLADVDQPYYFHTLVSSLA